MRSRQRLCPWLRCQWRSVMQSASFLQMREGAIWPMTNSIRRLKHWGRFSIAGSPSDADIVIELRYVVEDAGTKVWSSTNTYTGETQVHSHKVVDPQLSINIYESKSKDVLWSVTDHRRLAIREKNREKETINSADRLVDELKNRIPEDTKVTQPEQPH
jgi:hypothetical protein